MRHKLNVLKGWKSVNLDFQKVCDQKKYYEPLVQNEKTQKSDMFVFWQYMYSLGYMGCWKTDLQKICLGMTCMMWVIWKWPMYLYWMELTISNRTGHQQSSLSYWILNIIEFWQSSIIGSLGNISHWKPTYICPNIWLSPTATWLHKQQPNEKLLQRVRHVMSAVHLQVIQIHTHG